MGFNCLKGRATLRRQSTSSKFPEIPGTLLLTMIGWKAKSTLEPPSGFESGTPGFGIQLLYHLTITPVIAPLLFNFASLKACQYNLDLE